MLKFRNFFNYKKIFNAVLALFFIFVFGNFIFAEPANAVTEINAYFFWGEGCPHCEKEKEFLDKKMILFQIGTDGCDLLGLSVICARSVTHCPCTQKSNI